MNMNKNFFVSNRKQFIRRTQFTGIFTANSAMQRTNDGSFFEQEANFWWLTGIAEPNWQLILNDQNSWLVMPRISDNHRIFDGSLTSDEAKAMSGVDEVINTKTARLLIKELANKNKIVHALGPDSYSRHYDFVQNPAQSKLYKSLKKQFLEVKDCRHDLAKLRAIKQPVEIEAIRRAIKLTIDAFNEVKHQFKQYDHEYQIEADFTHYFRSRGAKGHAYEPIVASGKNACTLHYIRNQSALKRDELVLIDIGARFDGYAADITRTYAFGDVSERRKAIHIAVENAHLEIIALLKPGLIVKEYLEKVDEIMRKALEGLGLLEKKSDYRKYFPHSISHGLGIDVHDSLGNPETFLSGMVLTVEPGIYIPEEGIGVRIEDDILITETGNENLSGSLPTSL